MLRRGVYSLQDQEAAHIVDDTGQSDLHGGSGNSYGSDNEPRLRLLIRKDMFNTRSDDRLSCIRLLDMLWHGVEMGLFPVDLRDKALLFHEVLFGF
ncbi:hypothetical protein AD940_00890 [Gluconobacter thailandicus]|nr:hypothetical protein AD940_00890 [Gluconobacter thailandicus]